MRVLLDSNVLLRSLAGDGRALDLVNKVINNEWEGLINDIVVSEVIYMYLRPSLDVQRHRLRDLIRSRDRAVKELLDEDLLPLLSRFTLVQSMPSPGELAELIENYGLLPNDAIIALAAKYHGADAVA